MEVSGEVVTEPLALPVNPLREPWSEVSCQETNVLSSPGQVMMRLVSHASRASDPSCLGLPSNAQQAGWFGYCLS